MTIANTILKILTNKWTYIILFLASIIIIITVLSLRIGSYKNKIKDLNVEIEDLKVTNTLLYKDNLFKKEQLHILAGFSNSENIIIKITNRELYDEDKNAINAISNDFYNYFNFSLSNY